MITLFVGALFYFLPSVCAFYRKHNSRSVILVLNLLLGWTLIAWVVTLIWSLNADVERPGQYVYMPPPGSRPHA